MLSATAGKTSGALFSLLKRGGNTLVSMAKKSDLPKYETIAVSVPHEFVYHVELNRPEKLNALNNTLWLEIGKCFNDLNGDENCRVVVLSAAGRLFSAGIDFQDTLELAPELAKHEDIARKAKILFKRMTDYQKSFTALEKCPKPVLAAVHSACIGGGLELITAADMRYCSKDAWFQVKEVGIGMAADVGTLQRLPKIIGSDSLVRELCYTARKMPAEEALSAGLVSRVFDDKESLVKGTLEIAQDIAKKSPVAVQGTKVSLVYSRDHTVEDGLNQIATWNQLMLQSEDFVNALVGQANKETDTVFAKL